MMIPLSKYVHEGVFDIDNNIEDDSTALLRVMVDRGDIMLMQSGGRNYTGPDIESRGMELSRTPTGFRFTFTEPSQDSDRIYALKIENASCLYGDIEFVNELGSGSYGAVYFGKRVIMRSATIKSLSFRGNGSVEIVYGAKIDPKIPFICDIINLQTEDCLVGLDTDKSQVDVLSMTICSKKTRILDKYPKLIDRYIRGGVSSIEFYAHNSGQQVLDLSGYTSLPQRYIGINGNIRLLLPDLDRMKGGVPTIVIGNDVEVVHTPKK